MRLKEARTATGLGRRRASRCIGMGVGQLYRYEAGRLKPGIEAVMRISQGLAFDDPWQIDEFRVALEQAESLGLTARPDRDGHGKAS